MTVAPMLAALSVLGSGITEARAGVRLTIIEATLDTELRITYRVDNLLDQEIAFTSPEWAPDAGDWGRVPFLETAADGAVLDVASYVAVPPPDRLYEALYLHHMRRLSLEGHWSGEIRLSRSLESNEPYGTGRKPLAIARVRTVRLRLGWLPCLDESARGWNDRVAAHHVLECAGGRLVHEVQRIVSAEAPLKVKRTH